MSEEDLRVLHRILSSGQRLGLLIDGLMRFSRLGRQALSTTSVNLRALVAEVLEEARRQHEGRRVEVQVTAPPDCVGDPGLIRQVFVNLIANAFKFTAKTEN